MPIVHCIIMRSLAVHDLVGFFMGFFWVPIQFQSASAELIDLGQFLDDFGGSSAVCRGFFRAKDAEAILTSAVRQRPKDAALRQDCGQRMALSFRCAMKNEKPLNMYPLVN